MYTWTLICALAILSAAGQLKALPVFPENSRIQEEFDPKMTEGAVGFLSNDLSSLGAKRMANVYSVIPKQEEIDLGGAGLREDTVEPLGDKAKLIDNVMMLLWKFTSTQNLQQRRFSKPAQASLQSSKRACFWKYCVTD
ncbi:urotensin-related peptide 1 [Rhincodon typus]|uniref:urotensin-related peptide 1 n=1 Tax=Rhincodon typus TaxID=259920 RepID=UPI0020308A6F|nr:urotensin-related peptide 1 [Rhincodon typus]XP_048460931.1 urotensin-related peptide 1 [Rhincodon typus]XP_048460932.1 urotensin-related peptide 1 [Rhincodon typus]XP_048460933.1 urotensin-related peptide 1 [Rhincodon typus]